MPTIWKFRHAPSKRTGWKVAIDGTATGYLNLRNIPHDLWMYVILETRNDQTPPATMTAGGYILVRWSR